MADLHIEMTHEKFNKLATTSITNWWNNQNTLVNKFGQISPDKVYSIRKIDITENFKGLFGVSYSDDKLFFIFTFYKNTNCCYLTIYKKQDENIINL